jgi:hypothetical protein
MMSNAALSRDDALARSRRADWRFLFADPRLGEVLYTGRADASLIEACETFATSMTLLDDSEPAAGAPEADTVVAVDADLPAVARAVSGLRRGGRLYAELRGPFGGPVGLRRPRSPVTYGHGVERLGFEDVRVHLHWPTFSSCIEIVPLAEAPAVRHWLRRHREGIGGHVKAAVAATVVKTGGQALFATSVVATRAGGAGT